MYIRTETVWCFGFDFKAYIALGKLQKLSDEVIVLWTLILSILAVLQVPDYRAKVRKPTTSLIPKKSR
jgi:hypothetical protein